MKVNSSNNNNNMPWLSGASDGSQHFVKCNNCTLFGVWLPRSLLAIFTSTSKQFKTSLKSVSELSGLSGLLGNPLASKFIVCHHHRLHATVPSCICRYGLPGVSGRREFPSGTNTIIFFFLFFTVPSGPEERPG